MLLFYTFLKRNFIHNTSLHFKDLLDLNKTVKIKKKL